MRRNSIANYIGQFYVIFIGILMLPLYLKYLGAETYGLIGFFTILQAWLGLLDVGLSPTLTREAARLKHSNAGLIKLKKILRSIEAIFTVIAVIIFLSIWAFSEWIARNWLQVHELSFHEVAYCITLMGFIISIRWVVGLYKGCINGLEYQVWLNSYGVVINTLRFVGAYFLVKYLSQTPSTFFEYQATIALIEFVVIAVKLYGLLPTSSNIVKPSFREVKEILPYALNMTYLTILWVVFTQLDKLMLSHYIPLRDYAYYAIVVAVSGALLQLSSPLMQAIMPRMVALYSQGQEKEMLTLYRKATQFISVLMFSVCGMVAVFGSELLYLWTESREAANWGGPILFWYALGNCIMSISAFQYYLQVVHGDLKYHVRFNVAFILLALPIIYLSVLWYGAMGAAIAWFGLQLVAFIYWPAFIHHRFAPGMHCDWLLKDVLPLFITSVFILLLLHSQINIENAERLTIFFALVLSGVTILTANILVSKFTRQIVFSFINRARR